MARTFYSYNLELLRDAMQEEPYIVTSEDDFQLEDGQSYKQVYLGSFMYLDPCGRYHHVISPNGLTQRCVNFWESLDSAADRLGCWITSGEGDPTDIFVCWDFKED